MASASWGIPRGLTAAVRTTATMPGLQSPVRKVSMPIDPARVRAEASVGPSVFAERARTLPPSLQQPSAPVMPVGPSTAFDADNVSGSMWAVQPTQQEEVAPVEAAPRPWWKWFLAVGGVALLGGGAWLFLRKRKRRG